jgi:ABC-2 type transport system ATP-binding protein
MRMLLDLIAPTAGSAWLLGLDSHADSLEIRRRVGYLAGDFALYPRLTGAAVLDYLGDLRGGVPTQRIEQLASAWDLDLNKRIGSLSKGNRQKLGVLQAFMHRPPLLILDEPTSGLDPFLQQQFVALVHEAADNGQTVFMSSHVMSEVQQTCDRVGIIRSGFLVAVEHIDDLRKRALRKIEVHFDSDAPTLDAAGVSDVVVDGKMLRCKLSGDADALVKALARYHVVDLISEEPELEELFFTYYQHEEA